MKSKIKNQKFFLTLVAVFPLLFSCEYETLPTYSGVDQIYFANYDVPSGNTSVTNGRIVKFGYDDVIKADSTITILVKVMGSITDFPRSVDFILDETKSSAKLGRDIELLHERSLVPAGVNTGRIVVKLKNTEALDDTLLVATLRLVENEFFKTDYIRTPSKYVNEHFKFESTEYLVLFDNAFEMPNLWAHPTHGAQITTAFGKYSRKKFELMCQVLPGCSRAYFTYKEGENPQTVFNSRFPIGVISAWARALHNYLLEYYEKNGEWLLDENGEVIESGSAFT